MSIANRIESIKTHLENDYESLSDIGIDSTGTNRNIENISDLVNDYYNYLPKVNDEGVTINLNNTKKGKISYILKGQTSQNETPTPTTPVNVDVVTKID